MSDAADHARRLNRRGEKEFVALDAEVAEERYRLEPVEFLTPVDGALAPEGRPWVPIRPQKIGRLPARTSV
jgi:hypothetical protein